VNTYKTVETPRESGLLSLETEVSPLYTSTRGIIVESSPNSCKSSLVAIKMYVLVSVIAVAAWAGPSASLSSSRTAGAAVVASAAGGAVATTVVSVQGAAGEVVLAHAIMGAAAKQAVKCAVADAEKVHTPPMMVRDVAPLVLTEPLSSGETH
jgi:hypothetical protein